MSIVKLHDHSLNLINSRNDPQPTRKGQSQSPVFILGIMERSGTNFLSDLLLIHPEFALPAVLNEDFVMEHAHLLLEYVDRTYRRWKQLKWIENPDDCRNLLLRHLGGSILALLKQQIPEDKCLLAKTPGSYNSDKFFRLFPDAKLVVLIRDGRDAVESAVRSWPNRSYEYWAKQWARGARAILDLIQSRTESRGQSWHLLRYEDLVEHPEATVVDLLRFLGIDPDSFDWGRLERIPVHGSSQYPDQNGQVTGRKIEKTKDFKPVGRWQNWGWFRKRMFKKVAGKELISLGYALNNHW